MNIKSTEFGLTIKNTTYAQIEKIGLKYSENECLIVNNKEIETHPFDDKYVFISWGDIEKDMPEEPFSSLQIRKWFKSQLPKAKLKWQIIKTER